MSAVEHHYQAPEDWKPSERMRDVLSRSTDLLHKEAEEQLGEEVAGLLRFCESPIEELFLGALGFTLVSDRSYTAIPQAKLGKYRVDFVVTFMAGTKCETSVIVECDGHAFHDKTKEQAARDKRRDRELAAMGYTVMRFTGSELHKDAHACVEEVVSYTQSTVYRRTTQNYHERVGIPPRLAVIEGGAS